MPLPSSLAPALRLAFAGWVAVALAGCVRVPPRPLDLEANAARVEARGLSGPEVAAFFGRLSRPLPAAGAAWELDDLVVASWALRGEVAGAAAELAAARSAEGAAALRPGPSASLVPEFVTNVATGVNPWTVALALSWPFEPVAKRQARVARSRAETRLAALDLAATLWQLRQEVARAWEELALARAEEALAGEEVSGRRALLHWVETLLRFGAGSQPDVLAAQGELARAEAQAAASATAIVKAKGDLARALGLPLEGMERIQLAPAELQALPEASTFGTAELGGEAVRNRLDLDRAVAAYARAEAALAAEVAAQVPDLSLGPGLTYDQGQKKLVFGVGLSLPNPPAARAAIRAAWFARERAAGEVERVQADLEWFAATYGREPVFRADDQQRPMVIWSGTWEFTPEEIARVSSAVGESVSLLASERNTDRYDVIAPYIDGNAYYWSSVNPDTYPDYPGKLATMGQTVHTHGGLWIAPAAPGFDARLVGGTTIVERNDGETLRREVEAALASAPDVLGIISWNEFSENSHVEPSLAYGNRYLDVLASLLGAAGEPVNSQPAQTSSPVDRSNSVPVIAVSVVLLLGGLALLLVRRHGFGRGRNLRPPGSVSA